MNFLAPVMLFGAAAVAIPIAIHFFFRARHRIVPWAAMQLPSRIDRTNQPSASLPGTAASAHPLPGAGDARPRDGPAHDQRSARHRSGRYGRRRLRHGHVVQHGRRGRALTRHARAKAAALEALEKLPAHSTVQVVSSTDRADLLGPRSPSNIDQARELIKNLELSALSTDFAPAALLAKEVLQRSQLPNKELYVFSDFQKTGFDQQPTLLVDTLKELKDKANITLVRCGSRLPKNAAILGIIAQSAVSRPGQRSGFARARQEHRRRGADRRRA